MILCNIYHKIKKCFNVKDKNMLILCRYLQISYTYQISIFHSKFHIPYRYVFFLHKTISLWLQSILKLAEVRY